MWRGDSVIRRAGCSAHVHLTHSASPGTCRPPFLPAQLCHGGETRAPHTRGSQCDGGAGEAILRRRRRQGQPRRCSVAPGNQDLSGQREAGAEPDREVWRVKGSRSVEVGRAFSMSVGGLHLQDRHGCRRAWSI